MTERMAEADQGTVLSGRYRLRRLIGVGGMGRVWEAEDTVLERPVAVKLVGFSHLADASTLARFEREARTAARLTHPNLATVFDYGEADEGLYLVMELLDGETLADRLKRGPLTPTDAARVVAEAADALAAAHAIDVVHRDVKPSNLMLTDPGTKVMDFGIASGLGDSLTATGTVVGTAAYLAPERVRGESAGPPADVYALGAVLYEAVTGRRAYGGDTPAAVALSHLHGEPPDLGEVDPDLPPALVDATRDALARDPAARPSAAELAGRLRRVDGEAARATVMNAPVTAAAMATTVAPDRQPPTDVPVERSRGRGWLLALALLVVAALVVGYVALAGGDDDPEPRQAAPAPTTTAAPSTTVQPTTVPTEPPTTAPPTTAPPPAAEPAGSATDLAGAAEGYVEALDAGDFEGAWARTSPAFQAAQDRSSWESFWGGFDSIAVVGEPRADTGTGTVVLPLSFDGQTEDYQLTLVQGPDGGWLVDGPVGN